MAIFMMALLALIGFGVAMRFSGARGGTTQLPQTTNQYHGLLQAGLQMADYRLRRPDNPALAHVWSDGNVTTFEVMLNGRKATVTMTDKKVR